MSVADRPTYAKREFVALPTELIGSLDPYEMAVYLVLSHYADEHGTCWPRHSTIATLAKCSEPTVKRALTRLRAKGLVTWEARLGDRGQVIGNTYFAYTYRVAVSGGGPLTLAGSDRSSQVEKPPRLDHTDLGARSDRSTEQDPVNKIQETPTGPLSEVAQDARARVSRTSGELQRAWRPSAEVWSLAATRFPHVDLEFQHTQFMAYYLGKGLRSRDLEATWLGFMAKKERDEETRIKAEEEGPDEFGNMPWQHKPTGRTVKPGEPTEEELHALALAAARESRRSGGK